MERLRQNEKTNKHEALGIVQTSDFSLNGMFVLASYLYSLRWCFITYLLVGWMNTRVTRFSFEVWSSDPGKSQVKRENFCAEKFKLCFAFWSRSGINPQINFRCPCPTTVVLKLWYAKTFKMVREDLQDGTRRDLLSVFLHKKYIHSCIFTCRVLLINSWIFVLPTSLAVF